MKLTIFDGAQGDCLLLTSRTGNSILCDGGMPHAFVDNVAPRLTKALPKGGTLDAVYVSHIDQDHIGGVLQLLNHALEWKVFDRHKKAGDHGFKKPDIPRPPEIGQIWHNAFHELLKDNVGAIRDTLAANAIGLRLIDAGWARWVGAMSAKIANSIPEAIRVSRRISDDQLAIPLNKPASGKLMLVGAPNHAIPIGDMRVSVLGPQEKDLKVLRDKWNAWLRDQAGRNALLKIDRDSQEDEARLLSSYPKIDAARLVSTAKRLGDRKSVTPPNLASLLLHVEEDGQVVLLTGDGHSDDVEKGLEDTHVLQESQGLHVSVLKVPHHGSEHNIRPSFTRRITADHYVFCGNGAHTNPELEVVGAYLKSRLSKKSAERSASAEVAEPFHMWFSSSSSATEPKYRAHMKNVEDLVMKASKQNPGRLKTHFIDNGPISFEI